MSELIARGNEHVGRGEIAEGLALIEQGLLAEPDSAFGWFSKGCALGGLERDEEAVAAYRRCAELAPDRALPWYNLGNALQRLGRNQEAIDAFGTASDLDPNDPDPLINKARLLDDAGHHQEAIDLYDRALEMGDDLVAWSNRGNSLKALGLYDEAIASYAEAFKLDEKDRASVFGLGYCLMHLGQEDTALEVFDDAVVDFPDASEGWCHRAILRAKAGRHAEAEGDLRRAAELEPDSPTIWNNLGEVLGKLDRWEEALGCFDRALRIGAFVPALFGRGRALANLRRWGEARQSIERFLEAAGPDDPLLPTAEGIREFCREMRGED